MQLWNCPCGGLSQRGAAFARPGVYDRSALDPKDFPQNCAHPSVAGSAERIAEIKRPMIRQGYYIQSREPSCTLWK